MALKFKLITGRTLGQGEGIEIGKTSEEYQNEVANIFLNEDDMKKLGLEEGSPVKVATESGTTVVKCRKDDLDEGVAFMPLGPWASRVMSADTAGTGIPQSKGLESEITETNQKVKSMEEMMKSLGE